MATFRERMTPQQMRETLANGIDAANTKDGMSLAVSVMSVHALIAIYEELAKIGEQLGKDDWPGEVKP